jgi:hypothetical protein
MTNDVPTREEGHEREDVKVSLLKWILPVALVILAVIHLGVWWLYQYYRTQDQRRDVRRTLVETPAPVPPEPRLQVNPQADFQEYFRKQQETLKSYGWVSRAEGKVRIPIDRAMDLVVERQKQ